MSSAVQREETSEPFLSTGTEGGNVLRQLAAERLAAHRTRRAVAEAHETLARREQAAAQHAVRLQARRDASLAEVRPNASRVRDAVTARYQQTVSYREFLAQEAQRALDKARAEAEVAERSAKAIAIAQQQLLDEIDQWNRPGTSDPSTDGFFTDAASTPILELVEPPAAEPARARAATHEPLPHISWTPAHLQVKLHEGLDRPPLKESFHNDPPRILEQVAPEELAELDEEIEFRRSPEFRELSLETLSIQANIIEFPRQLVAPRKARPRLAEGPLRDEAPSQPQLRIFEVEPDQISLTHHEPEAVGPVWQGLLLNSGTTAEPTLRLSPQLEEQLQLNQQFFAAPLLRRLAATAVDGLCVALGLAAFAATALKLAGDPLRSAPIPLLAGVAAASLLVFIGLYQALFFTFNEATPGMRAARLAFCTFGETSPTRKALRRRMISTALAACPLGLGLLWTALDTDRLGWHDRISRMYPRTY
ncbi:MAG: hypothetical protein HIU91_04700 [Acidobacteria bacterium]|nr:hypothetical protein [Acidobacteriota bacterium]